MMKINKFFATTVSLFLLLLLGGVASYLVLGGREKSNQLLSDFRVGIYVSDSLTSEQMCALEQQLIKNKEVTKVEVITKEMAAVEFKNQLGISVSDNNPLPASLRVSLKNGVNVKEFNDNIAKIKGVEQVDYPYQIAKDVKQNILVIGCFVGGFCAILAVVILILFRNIIRLDVAASSESIKEAVGRRMPIAYIRQPFVVRAFTQGALAGALASVFLFLTTTAIATLYPFTKLPIDMSLMFVIFAVMILAGMLLCWVFAYVAVMCQIKNR